MIVTSEIEIFEEPLKSPSDRKQYRLLKLPNGLKVLLVKNAENTDINLKDNLAAVALVVDVGSFDDPIEVQGLSHFLEHMVFMGSQKYPKENEFDQYIKNRNGIDNAMTEVEYTIFYFKIDQAALSGAIDRFSQFFIHPLMLTDSMEREIEAVESEFQNDIYNDSYRINQIYSTMVRDEHPARNFTWGDLRTLKYGIDSNSLNKILHEFRRKFYKSNCMNLCIQSSMNLDILQAIVARYFNDIKPEYGTILKTISIDPFKDVFKSKFHQKIYFVKSLTKKRKLFMTFLLPSIESDYRNKSLEYLAYLFTHEGRYSLNSYFKNRNLALHVIAKVGARNFDGNSMFTFFTIEVNLTREGYENIGKVLEAIFSYLLVIKMTPMDEHEEIFTEFKRTKEILFKYRKEKSIIENVQELALNMKYFKNQDVIVGREVCNDFDEISLRKFINGINEKRFNLIILSEQHHKNTKKEMWFGTEYAEVDFPTKYSQLWNERWIRQEFSLPSKNKFICNDFSLVMTEESHEVPYTIFKNESCTCFFKPDNKFLLPHGFIYVHFISPLTHSSVEYLNMTSIYSMCVKNYLAEKLYPATLVGYNYKLNSVENGLILRLSGFNEKLKLIVDVITKAMKNVDGILDKLVFDIFRKELRKNCYNYLINSNQFVEDLRLHVLKSNHKFYYDRFKQCEKIDYNSFKEFLQNFFKSLKLKILIQGNFTESSALEINDVIINNLNLMKCTEKSIKNSTYKIPYGSTYLKIDVNTIESQCLLELLVKTIREPLFNILRTREQLGYAVSCASKNDNDILGFSIIVESQEKRNSARLTDAKIETFLWEFLSMLNEMNESDFEVVKRSIINQKRSIDNDLESEVTRNWNEIREKKYKFDRCEIEAQQMELLNKESLIIFFKEFVLSSSRRKLSIQVLANADDDDILLQHGYVHINMVCNDVDSQNIVRNLLQFKQTLEIFPMGAINFM
ncbi:nardilysin-like [Chironomus tepperi]|uniref:nardilysin-like n=1 Tax=Chironomus tepperi TaxID=113505 RepID=UPI00391F971D